MTEHDRITKEFGKRWADMVFGKGEFERKRQGENASPEVAKKYKARMEAARAVRYKKCAPDQP